MIYTPEPEVDPFEESAVTTGNLGVYDPLAPILGEDEPARKKRKPIPKIDAERYVFTSFFLAQFCSFLVVLFHDLDDDADSECKTGGIRYGIPDLSTVCTDPATG